MILDISLPGYLSHLPEKRWQAIILFSIFILQYLFEHVFPQSKKYNKLKNEKRNVLMGIMNGLLLIFPTALLVELLGIIEKNKLGVLSLISIPLWLRILVTIFIMDFIMYWWHRFNHTNYFLWRFHRFHHLDDTLNSTTALRFHTIELLLSFPFRAFFFVVIGFSFLPVIIYEVLFFAIVIIHHSNLRITRSFDYVYRKVFSSPLMHRIHHSNIKEETDSNYGSVFSFWDRLLGSYKKEASGEIVFGVDERKDDH